MCCMASSSYKSLWLSENCFIFLASGTVKNNSNETKWQYLFVDCFIIGRKDHVVMGRFLAPSGAQEMLISVRSSVWWKFVY